jgi:hypothetical protein
LDLDLDLEKIDRLFYLSCFLVGAVIFFPFLSFLPFLSKMAASTTLVVPFDGFSFHPHQIEAIEWMARREADGAEFARGGILAHEMGLGKTWTTIGHLLNSGASHTLILIPPVLQSQWVDALKRSRPLLIVLRCLLW